MTLNGWITEDINPGTTLQMKTYLAAFPLFRGPTVKVCISHYFFRSKILI